MQFKVEAVDTAPNFITQTTKHKHRSQQNSNFY